jgi:hypothetical protein
VLECLVTNTGVGVKRFLYISYWWAWKRYFIFCTYEDDDLLLLHSFLCLHVCVHVFS